MTRTRLRGSPYLLQALDAYIAAGTIKGAAAALGRSDRSVERSLAKLRDINGGLPTTTLCAMRGVRVSPMPVPADQVLLWEAA